MSDLHLYRVTVKSYPTPDGKPFHLTDEQVFIDGVEAWGNPGEGEVPAWFPADLESWMPYEDGTGYSTTVNTGYWLGDAELYVPVFNRRNWLSRSAANRSAQRFRDWGCEVTVEKSKPIEFEESPDA